MCLVQMSRTVHQKCSGFPEEDKEMNRQIRKRPPAKRPLSPRRKRWLTLSRDESGSVAVITAICLVFLLGFVALVVDVGHLYAVRNEVQNAADAAALAGARALFPTNGYPDATLILITDPPYCDLAVTAGRAAAARNQAGGVANLTTASSDVQTGIWDKDAKTFAADATPSYNINAVSATVRRDAVANQPVASWFASALGIDSTPVNAAAVAAVGYLNNPPPGSYYPIFIPKAVWNSIPNPAPGETSDARIMACPDPGDTFAWAAPDPESANASYLKDVINGVAGDGAGYGDTVNLSNGMLGSINHLIEAQVKAAKIAGLAGYKTCIMVGDRINTDDLAKMNQQAKVEYWSPVTITGVEHTKVKGADGKLQNLWSITFTTNKDESYVLPGGTIGGPPSQIFATKPVIVR
jgi:Flp pilus assembly protein TadG